MRRNETLNKRTKSYLVETLCFVFAHCIRSCSTMSVASDATIPERIEHVSFPDPPPRIESSQNTKDMERNELENTITNDLAGSPSPSPESVITENIEENLSKDDLIERKRKEKYTLSETDNSNRAKNINRSSSAIVIGPPPGLCIFVKIERFLRTVL